MRTWNVTQIPTKALAARPDEAMKPLYIEARLGPLALVEGLITHGADRVLLPRQRSTRRMICDENIENRPLLSVSSTTTTIWDMILFSSSTPFVVTYPDIRTKILQYLTGTAWNHLPIPSIRVGETSY